MYDAVGEKSVQRLYSGHVEDWPEWSRWAKLFLSLLGLEDGITKSSNDWPPKTIDPSSGKIT